MQKIQSILNQIRNIGPVLPGSLASHYNVCGNPNCRCKDKVAPQKHGPYFRLSYSLAGKNSSIFVKEDDAKAVEKMVDNYKKLRGLTVELALESLEAIKTVGVHATMEAIVQLEINSWKQKCRVKSDALRAAQVRIRDVTSSRDKWKEDCMALRKQNRVMQNRIQAYEQKTNNIEPPSPRKKKG